MKTLIHKILIVCLSLVFYACNSSAVGNLAANDEKVYADFSNRTYKIYIPSGYNASKKIPLVMAFHGAGGNGANFEAGSGFSSYAEQKKFIVVYPDALVENWEEGCECNKPYRLGIDDVGFVNYLIDTLLVQYNIDEKRIYAVGFSQGGLFVQNLACKLSDRFAAAATVASPMSLPLYNSCTPAGKISMLMIHGDNDPALQYQGVQAGSFSLVSSQQAIEFWANINGCDGAEKTESLPDNGDPSISVTKHYFESCLPGIETVLYQVKNGGHTWFSSSDINASGVIVDFLLSKSK